MLRIGEKCIVTFPNFGYWRVRLSLFFKGEMPVTKDLNHQWYDTPNIISLRTETLKLCVKRRDNNFKERLCRQ